MSERDNQITAMLKELQRRQYERLERLMPRTSVLVILGVIVLIAFVVAWSFVKPAPPSRIVIATGRETGAYYQFAKRYAKHFADNGIELVVRPTAGSIENYELLQDADSDVSLAIVQGGVYRLAREKIEKGAGGAWVQPQSIASLYLEPLWVFYRRDAYQKQAQAPAGESDEGDQASEKNEPLVVSTFDELVAGERRIAVGHDGSGTQAVALRLLERHPLQEGATGPTLLHHGGVSAADALRAGEIDAAFFVISPTASFVRELLLDEKIGLMNFAHARAYTRVFPFLSTVTLPRGVVDLSNDLPPRDVNLVAPAANLVASPDLHSALVPLLLKIAKLTHERGSLLTEAGTFPTPRFTEFPLHPEARRYFESGPSFLQRYLPFWVASFLDRTKIMLLPLLTLLIPLGKIAPPVYRWRIRSRIYRWYRILREIDSRLIEGNIGKSNQDELAMLAQLEKELDEVTVPLSYMEEFYQLRLHMELVQRRLQEMETPAPSGEKQDDEKSS